MMNKKLTILAACFALTGFASVGFAQTCAEPVQVFSDTVLPGTTCGGEIGINLGGAILAHPTNVYSFTYEENAGPDFVNITGAEREVAIATSCNTAPVGGAAPGVAFDLDNSGLVEGQQYLLFVTSDAGLAVTDPPRCGEFTLTPDTLPVELQNFSVD